MADLITVAEVKDYLKIAYSDEDSLLEMLIASAQEYAKNYLNHDLDEASKTTKLALLYLVSHWFEHRNMISTGNTIPRELPFTVRNLLDQTRSIPL